LALPKPDSKWKAEAEAEAEAKQKERKKNVAGVAHLQLSGQHPRRTVPFYLFPLFSFSSV
jgi:hypothetical protein